MMYWIEPLAGALLMTLVLLDVFFTILYARVGTEVISAYVARLIWLMFRRLLSNDSQQSSLSFCGPLIVVALLLTWSILLAFGAALIIHPQLGTTVTSSNQETPTDFFTALYVAGSSLSIVGGSNFSPQSTGSKLLFLVNSLIGTTVISLTITYLMQIYAALRSRNALCLKIHSLSGETGDAAELLAHLFIRNELNAGYNNLSQLAAEVTEAKEAHHFYPVLFYFRFPEPHYSVSRACLILMDAVALIRSALAEESSWLKKSGAVTQLSSSTCLLLTTLDSAFVQKNAVTGIQITNVLWEKRFGYALEKLHDAGICLKATAQEALQLYIQQRMGWDHIIRRVGLSMNNQLSDLDPAMFAPRANRDFSDLQQG